MSAIRDRHPFLRAEIATRLHRHRHQVHDRLHPTNDPVARELPAVLPPMACLAVNAKPATRLRSEIDTPCRINRTKCSRFSVIGSRPGRPLEPDLIATCLAQAKQRSLEPAEQHRGHSHERGQRQHRRAIGPTACLHRTAPGRCRGLSHDASVPRTRQRLAHWASRCTVARLRTTCAGAGPAQRQGASHSGRTAQASARG